MMAEPGNHVLVMGVGPLPPERPDRLLAPGLRTWDFATGLAGSGWQVIVLVAPFGGGAARLARQRALSAPGIEVWHCSLALGAARAAVRRLCRRRPFRAAVATTDLMGAALALAAPPMPIWLDLNGHPMAERQLLGRLHDSDAGLLDQWRLLQPILLGGDRFSVCSEPQSHALAGELLLAGRAGPESLVHVVRPSMPALDLTPDGPAARGRLTPPDACIALWTGGYNTWTDVDTLFRGLTAAMALRPTLHFVSTGGALAGHDDRTFQRFRDLVDPSPWRERFHFAGWAPLEAVKNYYADANVALNVDADTVEARLGHRNRVTEWVMAGTPVLSTALSEITRALAQADAMAVFAPGDAGGLTAALLDVVDHPDRAGERAARARQVVAAMFDPSITLAPLRRWVEDPVCANDLPPLGDRSGFGLFGTARPCYGDPGPWLAGLADDPVRSRLDWRRWPVMCSIGQGIVRVRRWWRGTTGQKRGAGPYSG